MSTELGEQIAREIQRRSLGLSLELGEAYADSPDRQPEFSRGHARGTFEAYAECAEIARSLTSKDSDKEIE